MVRAPLHFHGRIPVPEVSPLTYRDSVTHLELVYELSQYLKKILHPSLQSTVNQVVADAERLLSDATAQYVDGVEEFQRIHDQFMSDVNAQLMALNDSAVSDLVEDGTSLLGQLLRRTFEPYGEVHRQVSEKMGVVTPEELTFEQLQYAADTAAETGKRLWAAGELETTETLVIHSDADLGGLHIRYTGESVAVQLGNGDRLHRTTGTLPRVTHVGRDWSRNTTGIAIVNLYTSIWSIPHVDGFTVGMDVIGDDAGNVYNTYTIGQLWNNRVNQRLRGINDGWSNQNTYIGGWYANESSQGQDVTGARHIEMLSSTHGINNNLWLNPSVEGSTPEYAVYFSGSYNVMVNPRFEGGGRRPTVFWAPGSLYNHIMMGYQAQLVNEEGSTSLSNTITTTNHITLGGSHAVANLVLSNSSSANPSDAVFAAGADTSDRSQYAVSRSASETNMKRNSDTHPRLKFDHTWGRVRFGNGTEEPTVGFGWISNNALRIDGINTNGSPSNSNDPAGWMRVYVDGGVSYVPYYR